MYNIQTHYKGINTGICKWGQTYKGYKLCMQEETHNALHIW